MQRVAAYGDEELELAAGLARDLLEVVGRGRAPLARAVAAVGAPGGVPLAVRVLPRPHPANTRARKSQLAFAQARLRASTWVEKAVAAVAHGS